MRCNVDSQALLDARFKRLARLLAIDWREALGRCVVLWMTCYDARNAIVSSTDPDIVTELDGFGAALVSAGLAEDLGGDRLRIRGVADRIGFLERQRDRGRQGGRASVAKRTAQANAQALPQANAQPDAQALDNAPLKPISGSGSGSGSGKESAARAASACELSAMELATVAVTEINARSGTKHKADTKGTLTDCRALAKAKHTADDVRTVVAAKWAEWSKSDAMRPHFKPSTLLRPSNFERYLADITAAGSTMPLRLAAPDTEQIVINGKVYDVPKEATPS